MKFRRISPMYLLMKYFILIFFSFQTTFASESTSCGNMSHVQHVVDCILKQHIKILDLKSQEQVASLKQGAASYWPNPQVDLEGGVGQNLGDTLTEFRVAVAQPIEIGGKRGSRMALANAELDEARVEKDLGTLEVLIDVYGRILKIKELYIQENSLKKALEFVQKVSRLYQSRSHLDPEQTASKHLFEMLKQQYSFQLILIAKTKESELNELILMTQNHIAKEDLKKIIYSLPPPQWPVLKSEIAGNSLWLQKLKTQALVSEKKYDYEVSLSFPDVEIGPYYSQQYEGPLLTEYLGIAVSFPFPMFNINSGGRALAKAGMQSALYKKNLMEAKEQLEIKFLLADYKSMVAELDKLGPLLEKSNRSNPTMNLFERGLIPATFAIESQRSHQELIMTAHELELRTLETLFKIRSIEGNLDSATLSLWPQKL